jgi:hypothetical protein
MCGRYYRKSDKQKIAEAFHATKVDEFPLPPWDGINKLAKQIGCTVAELKFINRWGAAYHERHSCLVQF